MIVSSRRGSPWRLILTAAVAAAGFVNVVSAMLPAQRERLEDLRSLLPLSATRVATVATVIAGVSLLVLAWQLRRGKHRAMLLTVALLLGSVVTHVLKGLDIEEAFFALALSLLIFLRRKDFQAESDPASMARFFRATPVLILGILTFGVAALWVNRTHVHPAFTFGRALKESALAMVAISGPLRLTGRFHMFWPPTMAILGIGTAAFGAFLLFRPVIVRLHQRPEDLDAARMLVRANGDDSLSYFALRRDKDYFFNADRTAFLAYRYIAGLALVSGDPIGPRGEWPELLEQFAAHCRRHDWRIAVVGAAEDSLPLYRGFGFRLYHMGDEAVIHPKTFSLDGREMRNIRQSANRVRNDGYTFRLIEEKELDAATRKALIALSHSWRGQQREYGFSMALGRLLAPEDRGYLVAIASDSHGAPQGFLQLVPYRGGRGYSLDAMRRNRSAPAGLNEFLITAAAAELRRRGSDAFSLNFAAFARQISPVEGFHPIKWIERRFVLVLSKYFQIESLYRFNEKFDPAWVPRYLVYEERLDLFRAGLAIAQAEAFIRLPLVGRYF